MIVNINAHEHFKHPRKREIHLGHSREKSLQGAAAVPVGLRCGQDINLWARGENSGENTCLGADSGKGTEVEWERQWEREGRSQAWRGVWLLIFHPHELWPKKILAQVFALRLFCGWNSRMFSVPLGNHQLWKVDPICHCTLELLM